MKPNAKSNAKRAPKTGDFKPGNPGGPGGARPMKEIWEKKRLLDAAVSNEDWRAIFGAQRDKARGGSTEAAKFLAEHRWGKPAQDLNLGGQDGESLADILRALAAAKAGPA